MICYRFEYFKKVIIVKYYGHFNELFDKNINNTLFSINYNIYIFYTNLVTTVQLARYGF